MNSLRQTIGRCCLALFFLLQALPNIANNGVGPLLTIGNVPVPAAKATLNIRVLGNQAHHELELRYQVPQGAPAQFFWALPQQAQLLKAGILPVDSTLKPASSPPPKEPSLLTLPAAALGYRGKRVLHGRFQTNRRGDSLIVKIAWRQSMRYHEGDFDFQSSMDVVGTPDTLQLDLRFSQQRFAPLVRSAPAKLRFSRYQGDYIAAATLLSPRNLRPLNLQLPTETEGGRSWMGAGKDTLPFVVQTVFPASTTRKKRPHSIAIFWDCSSAAAERELYRELGLLRNYLEDFQDVQVTVYPLAHLFLAPKAFSIQEGNAGELLGYLGGLVYDGHSTLQAAWPKVEAEEVFLFPGQAKNLLAQPAFPTASHVYCIQSTPSLQTGLQPPAQTLDLTALSLREARAALQLEAIRLLPESSPRLFDLKVRSEAGEPEVFTITGRCLRGQSSLSLVYKAGSRTLARENISLNASASRATVDLVNGGLFHAPLLPQTDGTEPSLPPTSLPNAEELAYRQGLLQEIWTDLSEWYDDLAPPQYATAEPGGSWPAPASSAPFGLANGFHLFEFPQLMLRGERLLPPTEPFGSKTVTWMQHPRQQILWGLPAAHGFWLEAGAAPQLVRSQLDQPPGWQRSASYLDSLSKAGKSAWQTYPTLRKRWQKSPSFFIDAADHFIRLGEVEHAEIVLSNLLAPGHNSPQVLRAAAHRLQALGQDDLALVFFRRVYELQPQVPPVIRDLALALAEEGEWQEALEHLLQALYSLPELFRTQSPGLRNILLTELNHLLAASAVPLDRSQIPARWVRPLPLDLRVVIDWNRSDTDVDLWVTDPNGERCHFDLPFTRMGGKMAGDVTDGFGPEAFALKNALPGKYLIELEYDDDPEIRLSGPSFVKVTVFTDYGRPSEQKQVIPLRLEEASAQVQVATVEIK